MKALLRALLIRGAVFTFALGALAQGQQKHPEKTSLTEQSPETLRLIGERVFQQTGNADSLLHYATLALLKAQALEQEQEFTEALLQLAIARSQLLDFNASDSILHQIQNRSSLTERQKADVFNQLGYNAYRKNNSGEALQHLLRALDISTDNDLHEQLAFCNARLAFVFQAQQKLDTGLAFIRKTLALLPQIHSPFATATNLSSATGIYIQAGISNPSYIDSAIATAEEALRICELHGFKGKGAQLCNSMTAAYTLQKDYKKALKYAYETLDYRSSFSKGEIIVAYFTLADCHAHLKHTRESLQYLDSIDSMLVQKEDLYYRLAWAKRKYIVNKDAGQFEAALKDLETTQAFKDSLYTIEKERNFQEIVEKYEKEKDRQTISEMQKVQEISELKQLGLWIGILAALLLTVVIAVYYRQRIYKHRNEALEIEQRLNRARMNPHIFFNTLTSLQRLILSGQNALQASNYLARYAQIMRRTLETTYQELISLEEEATYLEEYLSLQKTVSQTVFSYHIDLSDEVEPSELLVPSMILQPFIENSLEHGFRELEEEGFIRIRFELTQQYLVIVIEDNGTENSTPRHEKNHTSRAMEIVNDRLNLLNKQRGMKASLSVTVKKQGRVNRLQLPIIYAS